MIISKTGITNTPSIDDNSDAAKILMMDGLIEHFAPLFHEELRKKRRQLKTNLSDIQKLKRDIETNQKHLEQLKQQFIKENLKVKILDCIKRLNKIDVLYGRLKIQVIDILTALEDREIKGLEKDRQVLEKLISKKQQS